MVLAAPSDAGVVSVYATRAERDDRFIARPPFIEPKLTLPLAMAESEPFWVVQITPDGGVLHAEAARNLPMACLFYDCERHDAGANYELRTSPLPIFANLRGTPTGPPWSKLGFAPLRPATGQYLVRVITVFSGDEPDGLYGSNITRAPVGCDREIDDFRDYWPDQATRWTNGQLSLELRYVDEGVLRVPVVDGGALNSDDTARLELFLKRWFQPGERDLMLVIVATNQPAARPGRAIQRGFAFADMNRENEHDALWVARHEIGHLFGASDLYNGATGDCAYAPSAEMTGPNLYCGSGSGDLVRLTAREVGWLDPDGGPATTSPSCTSWPGSQFGCDQ